jgi:hypothetical protein
VTVVVVLGGALNVETHKCKGNDGQKCLKKIAKP